MRNVLEVKVEFANKYLNKLLRSTGKVTGLDIYSVVTRQMRESGELRLIDADELLKLTKDSGDIEFVKIKDERVA